LGNTNTKLDHLDEARSEFGWISWESFQLRWTKCSSLGPLVRVQTWVGQGGRPKVLMGRGVHATNHMLW
ncbi:hypothetical protein IGI04_007095, partial [Brassica rapa subsp. trilocularis]